MRITKIALAAILICAYYLLAPLATNVYADDFTILWSGAYGDGVETVDATNEGGGEFLITSILAGTQDGLALTLISPGTYGDNDNLIFPYSNPLLDVPGIGFSDGINDYNIWAASVGGYWECSSALGACANTTSPAARELTSFSIAPAAATPEPSTCWLLAAGSLLLVAIGMRRKRLARSEG
jgi:hypothetical protein